jgi:cytochrome P450
MVNLRKTPRTAKLTDCDGGGFGHTQIGRILISLLHAFTISKIFVRRFLPTKQNKRMKEIDREIRTLLKEIINKREREMKATGNAANDDFLGMLLESSSRELQESGNKKNAAMSITDVIEECKLFYIAGQETTADLVVWTMVLLSKYPSWQVRAREEVLQVFGKNKPDFDGLNHLKVVSIFPYQLDLFSFSIFKLSLN